MVEDVIVRHAIIVSNGLYYAAILFLVSIGLSMIFGVLNFLNLAHAAFLTLGAFLTTTLIGAFTYDAFGIVGVLALFAIVLVVVPIVISAIGVGLEVTLFRYMYDMDETFQLLATFGFLLMIDDVMKFIWGASPRRAAAPSQVLGSLSVAGRTYPLYILFVIAVTVIVAVALYYFFEETKLGKITLALAEDEEMVRASGVDARTIHFWVFVIGVGTAALGGAMWVPNASVTIGLSIEFVLLAFAVIVIGGLGSLKGAIAASLIIGLIRSYGIAFVPAIELAIVFVLMAVVMIIRPTGLYGGIHS